PRSKAPVAPAMANWYRGAERACLNRMHAAAAALPTTSKPLADAGDTYASPVRKIPLCPIHAQRSPAASRHVPVARPGPEGAEKTRISASPDPSRNTAAMQDAIRRTYRIGRNRRNIAQFFI